MEIYKTTNKITGEFYIGLNSTSNNKYLGSGSNFKSNLHKYGKENFTKEILCVLTSSSSDFNLLREIETIYITKYIQDPLCLNICPGYNNQKIIYKDKIVYIDKIIYKEKIVTNKKYVKQQDLGRTLAALLKD
jgi:hypothetical protein